MLVVAVGCGGDESGRADGYDSYVALGDSYTAGSGIGQAANGAGAACGQVSRNYPRLVADKLGAELRDASCAGARTDHAFMNQTVAGDQVWPAQLNQLDRGTDLVTVSFGYNDLGFVADALLGCVSAVAGAPDETPCPDGGAADPVTDSAAAAVEIGRRLESVLDQVHRRAPDARVLVVGYPQPVPAEGHCAELGLRDDGYAEARRDLGRLDDAMRAAAKAAHATYVDVFGASEGHDVCAGAEAWVNGRTEQPGVAIGYHPFQVEQDAVAALVEEALAGS